MAAPLVTTVVQVQSLARELPHAEDLAKKNCAKCCKLLNLVAWNLTIHYAILATFLCVQNISKLKSEKKKNNSGKVLPTIS